MYGESIYNNIIEENDQTQARLAHLSELKAIIGNVYPNKFERTSVTGEEDTITAVVRCEQIKQHIPEVNEGEKPTPEQIEAANRELNKFRVRISGRIATPPRVMGKAAFVHLSDGIERLQIYVRKQDAKAISNDTLQPIEEEGKAWEVFNLLDHGDFLGVSGYLFVTKTGELSVHVETLQFLSKALLPMPDKMHGIADPEIRQRQRYADLIAGSLKVEKEQGELTTREVFEIRSKVIREMRRFLDDAGYIEVETPMLTPKATGAAAKPFETHHNALDITLYARIAPELYLKRLTVGGFEKVYELNRNFRNEGISYKHNPEFTMLEFYCAYMDVNGMMDFCEELLREAVLKATGGLKVNCKSHNLDTRTYETVEIDFSEFKRWTMKEAIAENWPDEMKTLGPEDFSSTWLENKVKTKALKELAEYYAYTSKQGELYSEIGRNDQGQISDESLRVVRITEDFKRDPNKKYSEAYVEPPTSRDFYREWESSLTNAKRKIYESEDAVNIDYANSIVSIFEAIAEKKLIQPTFITDHPKAISPLSKASPTNPFVAERFELFINGMECANGFSELNDPQEQYERFLDQLKMRERGDEEAMVMDEDYIRALSYGMPPAAGIGIGIDRLVMLLTNRHSIRDVILFPHLRPERKEKEESEEKAKEETA